MQEVQGKLAAVYTDHEGDPQVGDVVQVVLDETGEEQVAVVVGHRDESDGLWGLVLMPVETDGVDPSC